MHVWLTKPLSLYAFFYFFIVVLSPNKLHKSLKGLVALSYIVMPLTTVIVIYAFP